MGSRDTFIIELDEESLKLIAALLVWVDKDTESDTHRATANRALMTLKDQVTDSVMASARWVNPFKKLESPAFVVPPGYAGMFGNYAIPFPNDELEVIDEL